MSSPTARAIRRAPVGKVVGGTLYLHRSALATLPAELLELVRSALDLVALEELGEATLVKIDRDGAAVSFLSYPGFDELPHPPLERSVTVRLPAGPVRVVRYQSNRPILHRKETFVGPGYPARETFARLTRREEELRLLDRRGIGRELAWTELLEDLGLELVGHEILEHP